MFDMGFSEILLIAVVSLIVIGPKRLPETVRFLGYWLGKLRRSVHNARQEMERELGLDDIRRDLHNEALLSQLDKERKQLESALSSAPRSPAPTPAHNEAEMLQAFDDFDQEFGEAASINTDGGAVSVNTPPTQTPNAAPTTAHDANAAGTTTMTPATITMTAATEATVAPKTVVTDPAARPAIKSGESGKP